MPYSGGYPTSRRIIGLSSCLRVSLDGFLYWRLETFFEAPAPRRKRTQRPIFGQNHFFALALRWIISKFHTIALGMLELPHHLYLPHSAFEFIRKTMDLLFTFPCCWSPFRTVHGCTIAHIIAHSYMNHTMSIIRSFILLYHHTIIPIMTWLFFQNLIVLFYFTTPRFPSIDTTPEWTLPLEQYPHIRHIIENFQASNIIY